jgi:putative ABC transport system permease protein
MVPAWETMRNGIGAKMTNRGSMGGRSGSVLQRTVIALELALTLVLLVSGALLARSLAELMSVDTGFRSEGLAMVRTYLPAYRYGSARERAVQAERMRAALAGVPGVLAASGTNALPFYNGANALSYGIEGQESPEELSPHASFRTVLPGFFETMGIEIIEGRSLLDTDALGETPAVVISETMARRHWPHASPIGAKILFGDTLEVVGVAADVVHEALDAEPLATMYVPAREVGTSMNFVVRTSGASIPRRPSPGWRPSPPLSRIPPARSDSGASSSLSSPSSPPCWPARASSESPPEAWHRGPGRWESGRPWEPDPVR